MKELLLKTLSETRGRETELESLCVDGPADADGRWAAKDHLAHLAWWRQNNSAATIDAVRRGAEPPNRVEVDSVQNAAVYEATKDLTVAAIKQLVKTSWQALERAVDACTEEDLVKEHPRTTGFLIWQLVPAHAGHVGTHVTSWLLDEGDVEAARAVALWAHGVETDAISDPIARADADYNLACFYARVGQPREALPLLRTSLKGNPDLAAWAHEDRDLNRIRDDTEFKELLAT